MLIIQRIQVRWSKRSRGTPGSSKRSAVPTALPVAFPKERRDTQALLQSHAFDERHDFADRGFTTRMLEWEQLEAALPELRIRRDENGRVMVQYRWCPELGAPPRARSESVALQDSAWIQVVHNARHGLDQGWFYEQIHLNICTGNQEQAFLQEDLRTTVLDCRARLW